MLIILSLSVACGNNEGQFENIPIVISQHKSQAVDIDLLIGNVQKEVQKTLPNAYLTFFSFVGKCSNLPKLEGEIWLDFAQIQPSVFGDRAFVAEATVNADNQTLSFDVRYETEHYPNLEPLILDGKSVPEIANILHDYLDSMNGCINTVALTRVGTESPWRARCGPPTEVFLECVEIDPESGRVTDLK